METVYDVLRLILNGLRVVGGITEADHHTAHAIVDAEDPHQAAANAPSFSDTERAELERLQAKQQAADAWQQPQQEQPAPYAPPPPAVAGAGFRQQPAPYAPPPPAAAPPPPVFAPGVPNPQAPTPQSNAPTFPLPVSQAQ